MVCSQDFHTFDYANYSIPWDFQQHKDAFLYALEHGMNTFDASLVYGWWSGVAFLWKCLMNTTLIRHEYSIIAKLENIQSLHDIEKEIDQYLLWLGVDYIDTLLLHSPWRTLLDLWETYHAMEKMVWKKIKSLWISNASVDTLDYIVREQSINIDYFEWVYNLDCKQYEENGLLQYCKNNNILFTAYQPLRRNSIASQKVLFLEELSLKYNKTPNQILLNWITQEVWIHALVRASQIIHVQENIDSQWFRMEYEDYIILNNYRNPLFMDILVDRENKGKGTKISQIPNLQF